MLLRACYAQSGTDLRCRPTRSPVLTCRMLLPALGRRGVPVLRGASGTVRLSPKRLLRGARYCHSGCCFRSSLRPAYAMPGTDNVPRRLEVLGLR
eukprot:1632841-Rhodomonas_salina.2